MKKAIALILALMLVCSVALGEACVGKLYDAAAQLAFETDNVSLSGKAQFSYDGSWFKTMDAEYKQDGYKSYLSYMLDTPRDAGTVYNGGYMVVGIGNTAYASETYYGNYYYETPTNPNQYILETDPQKKAMVNLGRIAAVNAESLLNTEISTAEDGTKYVFSCGELPEFVNATAYYLVLDYLLENYYRYLWNEKGSEGLNIYCPDYSELYANLYKKLYNAELDWDAVNTDDIIAGRYEVACNWASQIESEIYLDYKGGSQYVYLHTDGSYEWFDNESDCLRAMGQITVNYADYLGSISAYYKTVCGEELTQEVIDLIYASPNSEIWDAFSELSEEMDAYYSDLARAEDPKAVYALVEDGNITVSEDIPLLYNTNTTVTGTILSTTKYAKLTKLEAEVDTDKDDRLTAFTGSVEFELTDVSNETHTLEISFELAAADYGTTSLPDTFVAADYGLVSYDEFCELNSRDEGDESGDTESDDDDAWATLIANAPETITFMGKTFETMMYLYE